MAISHFNKIINVAYMSEHLVVFFIIIRAYVLLLSECGYDGECIAVNATKVFDMVCKYAKCTDSFQMTVHFSKKMLFRKSI